jgi:hypothetical protein
MLKTLPYEYLRRALRKRLISSVSTNNLTRRWGLPHPFLIFVGEQGAVVEALDVIDEGGLRTRYFTLI